MTLPGGLPIAAEAGGTSPLQYAASPATLADVIFPRVRSDSRAPAIARDVALIAGFVVFLALCAQIAVRVPWTPVPITMQTFGVLVTGAALGSWRGAGAVSLYTLIGMFLLPVFTVGSSATAGSWDAHFILPWEGNQYLLWHGANGGYIVGFILAAAFTGYLAERRLDRGPWVHVVMLAGAALVYVPGLLWFGFLIATDWTAPGATVPLGQLIAGSGTLDKTLAGGLYPFIAGDLMKVFGAALVLPAAWAIAGRSRRRR